VVVFSDHLPVNARGKTERRALDALVAEALDALGRV
jgi:acyl-coenzyme A synthetase/AMP-(fatty) acid ligase